MPPRTRYSLRELTVIGEYRQEEEWDRVAALRGSIMGAAGVKVDEKMMRTLNPYYYVKERYENGN